MYVVKNNQVLEMLRETAYYCEVSFWKELPFRGKAAEGGCELNQRKKSVTGYILHQHISVSTLFFFACIILEKTKELRRWSFMVADY